MNEINDNEIRDLLKCFICSRTFDVPKVMPCGVSVCETCISKSYDSVDCSYCNQKHEISKNGFSTNYSIDRLLKLIEKRSKDFGFQEIKKDRTNNNLNHIYDNIVVKSTELSNSESKSIETMSKKNYEDAKEAIENEFSEVEQKINKSVILLINDIDDLKQKILKEIQLFKKELYIDLNEKFESENLSFLKFKKEINQLKNSKNLILETKKLELLENKMEFLIGCNKPLKKMISIDFMKNKAVHNVTLIGELSYGYYQYDIVSKIKHINNSEIQIEADLSPLLKQDHLNKKAFGIFAKNKIILIYEKFFGRVLSLFINSIYLDGTVVDSNEIIGVGSFHKHYIFDKYLLISFRLRKKSFALHLFNDKLELLKMLTIDHEIQDIYMANKEIYVIAMNNKSLIYEYDYEFVLKTCFGQKTNAKKAFFINGEIFSIFNDKIYVKTETQINILSKSNGETLEKIHLNLKLDRLVQGMNDANRFILFENGKRLSLYEKEELVIENTLTNKFTFDECQLTKSGHFCFINLNNNILFIV